MKTSNRVMGKGFQFYYRQVFFLTFYFCIILSVIAQEKYTVQVKTFDQAMTPYGNIDLSVNGKEYITVNAKGIAFTELTDQDLPVRSVRIKNEQLEVTSWNYSRGILEVMMRKKNYTVTPVLIKDENNLPVAKLKFTYHGKKNITATTDAQGRGLLPLPLGEVISTATQFSAEGYAMIKVVILNGDHLLTVSRLQPKKADTQTVVRSRPIVQPEQKVTSSVQPLYSMDTVHTLAGFYSLFKNADFKKLSSAQQQRADSKFKELLTKTKQPAPGSFSLERSSLLKDITDSTFFGSDMKKVVAQNQHESKTFNQRQAEFDEKLQLINKKLSGGIIQLDERARRELLHELTLLQNSLIENEGHFLKNQRDYRLLINSVRDRFFELSDLRSKLTLSERQYLKQEKDYDQRVVFIIALVMITVLFILVIIYFISALQKQKSALATSREEIKRMNDNLEGLILKRTRQLQSSNKELNAFLYHASRDLRSPVHSIQGLCDIGEKLSDNERSEIMERIASTADGMDELLKKLSLLNEINQPSHFSAITLLRIIEKIQRSHSRFIKEKRIELIVRCHEYVVFHSYPALIETIVTSLLENALYFSTQRKGVTPRVELTAEIKEMSAIICIRDNGIGVVDGIKDKLFDMFFKGTELSKGNGLGLFLVQKAVKVLEGKIKLDSVPGQFTEVTVTLPLKSKAENKKDIAVEAEVAEWK